MGLTARDVMQVDVRTVHPGIKISELERNFSHSNVGGFPVVDAGRLVGVVSRTDIVRKFALERNVEEALSDYYRDYTAPPEESAASVAGEAAAISETIGKRIDGLSVADVMAPTPVVTDSSAELFEVAQLLIEHRIHRVPVVDDGHLVGIITSTDLVRVIAEQRI